MFDRSRDVAGIDLDLPGQLALLEELRALIARWPYAPGGSADAETGPDLRYRPGNDFFGWTDSQLWYALLRRWRPRQVIEVGSGWSSALLLDTVDRHDLETAITCIEPYPERLHALMRPTDHARVTLLAQRAQDVDPAVLTALRPGDVLFIDSSHVSKVGSDVNHLFFEVLPRLARGVHVHVHDIAYPFEYPQEWIVEGRAWNEAYLLRAFLIQNDRWRITLWPSLLHLRHPDLMTAALHPATPVDGGSLWLESC
nr:class I SAM-dependent methyltransferase [Pseudonocardia acidicola]